MNNVCYITICDQVPHNISLEDCPKEIVYERVPIHKETIHDILHSGLSRLPADKHPTKILIGPNELFELTRDYRFAKIDNTEHRVLFENFYEVHGKYYGIELVIIPHMSGILIL